VKTSQRWLALAGLLSATLAAAAWILDKPDKAIPEIVAEVQTGPARTQIPSPAGAPSAPGPARINIEKLTPRSLGESTHDPFAMDIPPPGKRKRAAAAAGGVAAAARGVAAAALVPVAPPLPFTYAGKLLTGQEAKVFLSLGERNLVLREGDTVDSIYRVEKIADDAITLVYLPLDVRQTIITGDSP